MEFLQTRDSPRMMNACKNYYVKPQNMIQLIGDIKKCSCSRYAYSMVGLYIADAKINYIWQVCGFGTVIWIDI